MRIDGLPTLSMDDARALGTRVTRAVERDPRGAAESAAGIAMGATIVVSGARRGGLRGMLISGIGAIVASRGIARARRLLRAPQPAETRPDLEPRFGDGQRDIVEEASWESFPASDPPSFR